MTRTYTFTLILAEDPDLDQIDRLYGFFSSDQSRADVLSGVRVGVPYLAAEVEASSFEEALAHVMQPVREEGIEVERLEMEREHLERFGIAPDTQTA